MIKTNDLPVCSRIDDLILIEFEIAERKERTLHQVDPQGSIADG